MWLPKDERKLLRFYFRDLERPKDSKTYKNPVILMKELGYREQRSGRVEDSPFIWRVWDANDNLDKRGLTHTMRDSTGMDVTISLTLQGWDLGRKYDSFWIRSGLRFREYKDHWIWLIVAFLGGILGALVVNWLSKGD